MAGETLPTGSTNTQGLADWASPYITNYLSKAQALADTPYQAYKGPLTAGTSALQDKTFQGIANLAFPTNYGQSFSSTGAYQPPPMNMGAYQQQPIGTGARAPGSMLDMLNQGSNGLGNFGFQPATEPASQSMIDAQNARNAALPQNQGQLGYGVPPPQSMEEQQRIQNMRNQNLILDENDPSNRIKTLDMYNSPYFGPVSSKPRQMPPFQNMTGMETKPPPKIGNFGNDVAPPQISQPQGGIASLTPAQISQPQQPQQQAPGIASQYMNPYLQSVLTPQLEELRRQNEITNMKSNAGMTGVGAFGGGRQAIMNAENNRNLMQEMNKTVGQGYASAFDKGMGQFNTEQGQAKDLINLMGNAGAQQRGITAEGIAADKAEFEAQRQFPYQQAQYMRDMISGLPSGSVTNTPANLTGMGSFLSALGGGTAAASALGYKNVGDLLNSLGFKMGPTTTSDEPV